MNVRYEARLAITLVQDGVSDLLGAIERVSADVYREGVLDRFRDQRLFLSTVPLDLLQPHQAAAVVRARDACSVIISLMLRPADKDQNLQKLGLITVAAMVQKHMVQIVDEFDGNTNE